MNFRHPLMLKKSINFWENAMCLYIISLDEFNKVNGISEAKNKKRNLEGEINPRLATLLLSVIDKNRQKEKKKKTN